VPSQNKDKRGKLLPHDLVRSELHHSVTEVNEARNEKAADLTYTNIKTLAVEGVLNNNGVFSFEKTHSIA